MIDTLFIPWIWTLLGLAVIAAIWWRSRRVKRMPVRVFVRAFSIALFFTPFIPHASVQWSTPWPPAILWLVIGLTNGDPMPFELFTIAGVTLILWIAGLALSRRRKISEEPVLNQPDH